MATTTKRETRMTIEQFAQMIEAAPLTPKMRKFVLVYVQGYIGTGKSDPLAAAKASYACKDDRSARCMGYQLLANPKVILALNQFLGLSQKEVFLRRLERAIYDQDITTAQVKALELAAKVNGWVTNLHFKPPKSGKPETPAQAPARESVQSAIPIFPPAEPKYRVGTIENDPDDGKPYIILAVSTDGSEVTDARELTQKHDGSFVDSIAKGTLPTKAHVPAGARPGYDETTHALVGYGTLDGKTVWLVDAEAAR